jgi:hypothetical protein
MQINRLMIIVFAALCFVSVSIPALAQQRGSISGKVVDPTGAVLPGATVTVTEQNTGFTRTVITAETGAYAVPSLDPGLYTVTVELPEFATLMRTGLTLTAGSEMILDLKMQVGGVQSTIVVARLRGNVFSPGK